MKFRCEREWLIDGSLRLRQLLWVTLCDFCLDEICKRFGNDLGSMLWVSIPSADYLRWSHCCPRLARCGPWNWWWPLYFQEWMGSVVFQYHHSNGKTRNRVGLDLWSDWQKRHTSCWLLAVRDEVVWRFPRVPEYVVPHWEACQHRYHFRFGAVQGCLNFLIDH